MVTTLPGFFLAAAKLIEKHGWCRGMYSNNGSRRCVMAVLGIEDAKLAPPAEPELRFQARAFAYSEGVDINWNDHIAKSGKQVAAKLRELARLSQVA